MDTPCPARTLPDLINPNRVPARAHDARRTAAGCSGFRVLGGAAGRDDNPTAAARAVILIIGDGMDDQQITIARNYLKGCLRPTAAG